MNMVCLKGETLLPCKNEEDIYRTLKLDYIPPELREGWGEIEAAENHTLPVLVEEKDIQGAFHFHTHLSDGTPTLSQWVQAADQAGLKYLGISDHSQSAAYAGGLKPEQLEEQRSGDRRLKSETKKSPSVLGDRIRYPARWIAGLF